MRNHFVWLGPVVCFVAGVSYFEVFAKFAPLRDFPWVNLPLVLVGWAFSALAVWRAFGRSAQYRGKILGPLGLVLSSGFAGLFIFYVFVYSGRMPDQSSAGMATSHLPDFVLTDHQGQTVNGEDLRGKKAVLVFFRGHW